MKIHVGLEGVRAPLRGRLTLVKGGGCARPIFQPPSKKLNRGTFTFIDQVFFLLIFKGFQERKGWEWAWGWGGVCRPLGVVGRWMKGVRAPGYIHF